MDEGIPNYLHADTFRSHPPADSVALLHQILDFVPLQADITR